MSNLSLSPDVTLLVRDGRGRYRPASTNQILEVARQVIDQKVQRGAAFTSPDTVKDYLRTKLDHCRRIESQRFLDHFAWMYRRAVDGAPEQFDVLDQPVLAVEEQRREHFMLEAGQLGAQVVLDRIR